MASKNKKRRNRKKICVYILRAELYLCIFLICLTIGMQVYNLISPPVVSTEMPSLIGSSTLPFRLTTATVFPFFMLPLLGLVIVALLLQRFFSRNGFSYSDKIPFFDKHPHTRLGKKACRIFILISSLVSFALCCSCFVLHGLSTPWFGLIVVATTGCLHYVCAKMIRRCRRQYRHNKRKAKGEV